VPKKLIVPVLSACALLILSMVSASATVTPMSRSEWREVISLAPNQTSAEATVPMTDADCNRLLKSHANRSRTDCVTHYWMRVTSHQAVARSDDFVLTGFTCNVILSGGMWNFNWWSNIDVRFCWSPTYVYVYSTDCSNWGVAPGQTLAITWCGAGAKGTRADGGDNVTITSVVGGSYGAGQRAQYDIYGHYSFFCWNAHC
jgi:hypothetical protein